jgi:hypothetical protein
MLFLRTCDMIFIVTTLAPSSWTEDSLDVEQSGGPQNESNAIRN